MVSLYILKNNSGKHYVGITSLPVANRVRRHNNGDVHSTKLFRPWKIIYSEEFKEKKLAWLRERQIKSYKGGEAFKKLIN